MGKLYVVKYGGGTKIYRSEESLLRSIGKVEEGSYKGNTKVEVYDYTPSIEGTLFNIISSIRTANHRHRRIESLSNPDLKIIADIRNKFEELAPHGYHKLRLLPALDNCHDLKKLKSLLSSNSKQFLSIDNYDWYFTILQVHNFNSKVSYGDNFKRAKNDIKTKK